MIVEINLKDYMRQWESGSMDENDPYLHAFLIMGYDKVVYDRPVDYGRGKIGVYKNQKFCGVVDEEELLKGSFTIISGTLIDGRGFHWLSDGDGSMKKFKEILNNASREKEIW